MTNDQANIVGLTPFKIEPVVQGKIKPPTVPNVTIMLLALSRLFPKYFGINANKRGYKPPKNKLIIRSEIMDGIRWPIKSAYSTAPMRDPPK